MSAVYPLAERRDSRDRRRDRRRRDRRARARAHRRPVLGGVGGAASSSSAGSACGRCTRPARRRVQATHVAVCVPGAGEGGARAATCRRRRGRSARRHRGARAQTGAARRRVCGCDPDRLAQHARRPSASRRRRFRTPRSPEARHVGDPRGAPSRGRDHPARGKRERRSLRARDPHVRFVHTQLPRRRRDRGSEAADAPPCHRRPQPRHGPARARLERGAGRRRRRAPTA